MPFPAYRQPYATKNGHYAPKAKQLWAPGMVVSVGFMRDLTVIGRMATPGDGLPDEWLLKSAKNVCYSFQPHLGISRLDDSEAAACRARVETTYARAA